MERIKEGPKGEQLQEIRPKLWTGNYILAWLSSLVFFFAFDSMIPVLPLYMEIQQGVSGAAGLPMAALTLGALLIRPLAGCALDIYGRKILLWGGLLLFLLPAILYIWMPPAYTLIVLRFIQGIGFGISHTALFTVASDIIPSKRLGEGIGYFTAAMSLATAISPAVSSWVLSNYSYSIIFSLAVLLIVISMIMAVLIKQPPFTKKDQRPRLVFISRTGIKPAMVTLMVAINFSSVLSFLPVYAMRQGVAVTGIYFTAMALTSFLFRPVAGMLVDRKKEKGYDLAVIAGSVATILAILILSRTSSPLHLIVGGIFYGAGFAYLQTAMIALSVRNLPADKVGVANATYWTSFDLGIFIGSIVWGLLAAAVGYGTMFNLTIIPVVLALLIYFSRKIFPSNDARKGTEKLSNEREESRISEASIL